MRRARPTRRSVESAGHRNAVARSCQRRGAPIVKRVCPKCAQNRSSPNEKAPDFTGTAVKIGGFHHAVAVGFEVSP